MEKIQYNKHYLGKCYIKFYNTDINIEQLMSDLVDIFGYQDGVRVDNMVESSEVKQFLVCKEGYFYLTGFEPSIFQPNENYINCGTNVQLFLSLASLRDDTDKNQWFFSTGWTTYYGEALPDKWVFCDQDTLEHFAYVNNSPNSYSRDMWNKATTQDIISHFK